MSASTPQTGIPIGDAAERIGVTIELLRKRAQRGTIPAYKVDGRWFVVLDGTEPIVQDTRAGHPVQDTPSRTGQDSASRAVSPGALEQLEAVRDQWLQPLIDQIRELERDRGRLEEQRDQAVKERDEATQRLDSDRVLTDQIVVSLESERDILKAELDHIRAAFDFEAHRELLTAGQVAEADSDDAPVASPEGPGRAPASEGLDSRGDRESHVAGWLRKLFGRS